jgi:hypothetical protein
MDHAMTEKNRSTACSELRGTATISRPARRGDCEHPGREPAIAAKTCPAASAASYIAMAARRIVMAPGSFLMIHSLMLSIFGNPDRVERSLDTLRKVELSYAEVYAGR